MNFRFGHIAASRLTNPSGSNQPLPVTDLPGEFGSFFGHGRHARSEGLEWAVGQMSLDRAVSMVCRSGVESMEPPVNRG